MAKQTAFDTRVGDVFAKLDALSSRGGETRDTWFATSHATSTGARSHLNGLDEDQSAETEEQSSKGQFCKLEDDERAVKLANEFDAPLTAHELERSQAFPSSSTEKWRQSRPSAGCKLNTVLEDDDSDPQPPQSASVRSYKPCFSYSQTGKCRFADRCKYTHTAPSYKTNPQGFTRYKVDWKDQDTLSSKANANAAMAAIRQAAEAKKRGAPVEEAHVIGTKIEFKAKRAKDKAPKKSSGKKLRAKTSMLTFGDDDGDE
eukprot:TRINITY_DN12119_c0_g3_i2.p1 TRINITY_DN12119_c0_g3~~TRINITY_DN12119_c0_g3_i2.p1  ORF type:complete len:259 (+),score=48.02 TRINITY_DN12119_c0_g3_i2:2-778(+)